MPHPGQNGFRRDLCAGERNLTVHIGGELHAEFKQDNLRPVRKGDHQINIGQREFHIIERKIKQQPGFVPDRENLCRAGFGSGDKPLVSGQFRSGGAADIRQGILLTLFLRRIRGLGIGRIVGLDRTHNATLPTA